MTAFGGGRAAGWASSRRTSTATAAPTSTSRTTRTSRTRSTGTSRAPSSRRASARRAAATTIPSCPSRSGESPRSTSTTTARTTSPSRAARSCRASSRSSGSGSTRRRRTSRSGRRATRRGSSCFRNESVPGTLTFRDVSAESGDLGRLCVVGRGLSAGDLDGDGREDLVYNPIDAPAIVLRNAAPGGNALEILPVAGADRKTVLGTRVTARTKAGERVKEFYVVPSYASGSWLPLHFGLGAAASASVVVRWPDGTTAGPRRRPEGRVEDPEGRRARAAAGAEVIRPRRALEVQIRRGPACPPCSARGPS